jgi:hypothetical protein
MFFPDVPIWPDNDKFVVELNSELTDLEAWTGLEWVCHKQRWKDGPLTLGGNTYPEPSIPGTRYYLYTRDPVSKIVKDVLFVKALIDSMYNYVGGIHQGYRLGYHDCCGIEDDVDQPEMSWADF